jgi:uncharacterized membrane protein
MKKRKIHDERVITLQRKIQSDGFIIVMIMLLISIIVQLAFFETTLEHYAVELICFIGMGIYLIIRDIIHGNNIFPMSKRFKAMPLLISLGTAFVFTAIQGVWNYFSFLVVYQNNISLFLFGIIIGFISMTVGCFVVWSFISYLIKKRQEKIHKHLDKEEQDEV